MKRRNRNTTLKDDSSKVQKVGDVSNNIDTPNEDTSSENQNPTLSHFKLPSKKQISRQHLKVEYEDVPNSVSKDNKPLHWENVLQNIRDMRKKFDAPVDTMGCDQCPDENASDEDKRLQALLSLMLSSQTKDQVTHAAMLRLRTHGCTLNNILNTDDAKLSELIYPVCFYKTKTKNIKKSAAMIKDEFNSDIPNSVEGLCKLPGVSPKMAHLCMKTAWGQVTGMGVDTHVHRICNRLQWVKSKTPEETRKQLENWLPFELWVEVNHLLVGFGQQTCVPVNPQCRTCLNKKICPFGSKQKVASSAGKTK